MFGRKFVVESKNSIYIIVLLKSLTGLKFCACLRPIKVHDISLKRRSCSQNRSALDYLISEIFKIRVLQKSKISETVE